MIKLYTEKTYQQLYGHLLKLLVENNAVFSETWIVVPNHSAKQWLQKSLAKSLGVCTQIKFIMPLSFNWEILKHVVDSDLKINVFSKDVLRWQIYALLLDDLEFKFLQQSTVLENFNLAEKIAETLLAYNDNRPELINDWDNGVFHLSRNQEWQAAMWIKLLSRLTEKSPVQLLQQFNPKRDFKSTPNKIILFATEQLSALQKDAILKLASHQDIHILLSNPCPNDYWFDLKASAAIERNKLFNPEISYLDNVGNPLLANLGYNKMALFDVFLNENIELNINEIEGTTKANSLLESIKIDIDNLSENSPYGLGEDKSLTIHACHSSLREVEVISDEIHHLLDTNKSLNPEDIIVVAPDINDYVFAIKEIFNRSEPDAVIPFHIDRVQLSDHHYISTLMNLLKSFNGEMTAPVIYELLTHKSIYEKLNLTEDDVPRLKSWILESNIRNYYSAFHKQDLGFESTNGNTWAFGENRWLSGYLSGQEGDTPYLSTYGDIAGQEPLFTQCFNFLKQWFQAYQFIQEDQTANDWLDFIKGLCQDFLYNDYEADFEQQISQLLDVKLKQQSLECQAKVPLTLINNIVEAAITENSFRSEGLIGVRFQSWENAFIVDAKVLIVMGLNDGEFPKKDIKNDLDIFNNIHPRLNKSSRQRDKNLMLSALTESCEQLIMTYIGFNAKTNEPQPPSVLLADLINYLEIKTNQSFKVQVHKMHGFNQRYFTENPLSYNTKNYQLAQSIYAIDNSSTRADPTLELPIETHITLDELCSFFTDPLDFFLKNFAGINNSIYSEILKDTETYFPDGLETWQLKNEMFVHGTNTAIKTGIISDNRAGKLRLNSFEESLLPLTQLHNSLSLNRIFIDVTIENLKIHGSFEIDENKQLINIIPAKANGKRLCQHWLKHLCYQIYSQQQQDSYAYFEDKKIKFSALNNAQDLLNTILEKWRSSHRQPWLFCTHKLLNATQVRALKLYEQHIYLKGFVESRQSFPSEGQKYFQPWVKQYDNSTDVEIFLQPILDSVEFVK